MVYYVLDSAVSALAHILHEPCRWRIQANNAHSMAAVLVGLRLCRSFDGHQQNRDSIQKQAMNMIQIKKTEIPGARTLTAAEMNKIHFDTGRHTAVDRIPKPE